MKQKRLKMVKNSSWHKDMANDFIAIFKELSAECFTLPEEQKSRKGQKIGKRASRILNRGQYRLHSAYSLSLCMALDETMQNWLKTQAPAISDEQWQAWCNNPESAPYEERIAATVHNGANVNEVIVAVVKEWREGVGRVAYTKLKQDLQTTGQPTPDSDFGLGFLLSQSHLPGYHTCFAKVMQHNERAWPGVSYRFTVSTMVAHTIPLEEDGVVSDSLILASLRD